MNNVIYTGTLNDRFIIKANSIGKIKQQASRIANRSYRVVDTIRVTSRPNGELEVKTFARMSCREKDGTITRTAWQEKVA